MRCRKKLLPQGKVALLLINNANEAQDVHVSWHELPKGAPQCAAPHGCSVRDIYERKDLGGFATGFTAKALAPHDSAFIVVSDGHAREGEDNERGVHSE